MIKDLDNNEFPHLLYYATVFFDDESIETPHFAVFENAAEAAITIKEHYKNIQRNINAIELKEILFINTHVLPEESYILVPGNDFGLDDDFHDVAGEQHMIEEAESGDIEEAMMLVFPDPQEHLDVNAYYRGPMYKAKSEDDFVKKLIEEPIQMSLPQDFVWLYRPTGERHVLRKEMRSSESDGSEE